ncbi:DNA gyrase subunit A [Desulfovermiculus halophilus]|uniref:DNA gyrase subunit A n=1 Tax=Desulfovermiculus halophilus TaxID=339722 RepID=UPI0004805A51|nr:DNA gyrase subunit A [Desulfovermiculus halophilus]
MQPTVSIEDEIKKSYLEYSLSVIIGRAIPDVRDGLKPVHRRILYAMHDLGNTFNRPYKKSARIVGDVIGKYHPHGDAAVYDALVRMAQDFNMRQPLVDGQGNFGSIDGDAPAAMRYTESRMSKLAGEFLADIDKDTVNFRINYDNTIYEPEVLPTRVPNLLVNGAAGIAVGMATNIPPHNLGEVVDATLALLDNPELTVPDLMTWIKGPDFPTGAMMFGLKGLKDAYTTGRGSVKLRARLQTEERARGLESIVVTEIPYALNKANLIQKIAALINDRKIEGVSDLRDESDRTGIRIVIDLKKGAISDLIINSLYKYTSLETSIGINLLAVVKNRPKLLNLKEYLEQFIEHRQEVVLRRSRFELKKAQHRAHILEGLRIALDNIDEVVAVIRGSANPAEAKGKLISRFELSDVQSQAILDMRLQRLTNMEQSKIQEEYQDLLKQIEFLQSVINSSEVLRGVIRDELKEIKKTYPSPRLTQILADDPSEIDIQDLIADEEVVITLSRKGYIKRTPISSYNQQKRGGKGMSGSSLGDSDYIQALLTSTNHQHLLLFTNQGRVFKLKVFQIPEGSRRAKGAHISNLIDMHKNEYVATALSQRDLNLNNFFVFITKRGMVKRSEVVLYKNLRASGLIALSLRKDDELMAVREVTQDDELMLLTGLGFAIRFPCHDIRPTGRQASGVKGISLRDRDEVVSGLVIGKDTTSEVLTVTEHGYGKRTPLDHYRVQARGGKGIINLKPNQKTGTVLGGMIITDQDQVLILTSENKMIRFAVSDVRICGRAAQGVKLVSMDNGGSVICFDRIPTENGEE